MAKLSWRWEAGPSGVEVRLLEKLLLGRARPVPFADWAARRPEAAAAAARVARLVDEGAEGTEMTDDGVRLGHGALADLDDAMAVALGLPQVPPFPLRLVPRGLITDADFAIDARFAGPGDAPLRPAPVREGALLRQGSAAYRLSCQLLDVLDAAEALDSTRGGEASERMAALAQLKTLLPDVEARWVSQDGYLRTIRVAVPAALSLRLSTRGGRFDLDPVLFGREAVKEDGSAPLGEERALLAPVEDETFRRRFREGAGVPGAYALDRGTYLFLPPAVRAALEVVREVQRADPAAREAFARQPQRHLAERLGGRLDPALVEALFVETEQYSERVLGLGLWRPPVLPWVVRAPNGWLPERFGLRVGDREVEIPLGRLDDVAAALDRAAAAGEPEAAVPDVGAIPATPQAREAVGELRRQLGGGSASDAADAEAAPGEENPAGLSPGGKLVLLTKDNLEEVGFRRRPAPRAAAVGDGAPRALASALKGHQRHGLRWLQECWRAGEPGALLADDMGLGKTVQALAFLAWLREAGAAGPVLVVAPTGLLANWKAEEAKHLARPGLGELAEAYGPGLRRLRTGRARRRGARARSSTSTSCAGPAGS